MMIQVRMNIDCCVDASELPQQELEPVAEPGFGWLLQPERPERSGQPMKLRPGRQPVRPEQLARSRQGDPIRNVPTGSDI